MNHGIIPGKKEETQTESGIHSDYSYKRIINNADTRIIKVLSPAFKSFARRAVFCNSFIAHPYIKEEQFEKYSKDLSSTARPNFYFEKISKYSFDPKKCCDNISDEMKYMFKDG